ncbi:MAG: NAD(P)-dependent oxidoreductase [Lachnospiraceae bacterium]|nr:NAD(P)-dependent oxidoreductase [Lachnospiraceae bacterium]
MVVMVTGVQGQLGHDVINEAVRRGHKCFGTDIDIFYSGIIDETMASKLPYCHMDVSNLATVDRVIDSLRLDAVIHCASFSDIDDAEKPINYAKVMKVNAKGAENVAKTCKRFDAKLVYISSDYVYTDGKDNVMKPDIVTSEPESVFGKSKLLGEQAVIDNMERYFIVRTQWIYGIAGENFVKQILRQGENTRTIKVADDIIGTPTYTYDLARLLVDMIETEEYGIYNAVNEGGYVSKADVAKEVFRRAGLRTKVIPVSSENSDLYTEKRRDVRLCTDKLRKHHFRKLPTWDSAIGRFLEQIKYPTKVRGKLPAKE